MLFTENGRKNGVKPKIVCGLRERSFLLKGEGKGKREINVVLRRHGRMRWERVKDRSDEE